MADRLPPVSFPGSPAGLPAQEAVAFDDAFLTQVVIDVTGGNATFRWRRYNYAANRLMSDLESQLLGVDPEALTRVPNLWQEAAQYPLVQQVIGGLLAVADAVKQLLAARPAAVVAESALAALQSQQTSMQADFAARQQFVTDAQAAIAALPAEATDEEKATAQQALDNATANVANVTAALASLATSITAAEADNTQAAGALAAIETALGKA